MWSCTFLLAVGCCALEPLTLGTGSWLRGGIDLNQLQAYLLNELRQRVCLMGHPCSDLLTTQEKLSSCLVCICLSGNEWSRTSWIPICLRFHWAWNEIKTWIQEVVLLNIGVLGSKDGFRVTVIADLKPDLKWKSVWFRTFFTCRKVKKRCRPCWWTFLWVSAVTDMDSDVVVGVIQGFLASGNPDRWASLNYLSSATIQRSTQNEHYCEMCVQVWSVTVKQHIQLQLQVILFGRIL